MSDVYYDQYSVEINADPYPVYRRLREEAPIYYNDTARLLRRQPVRGRREGTARRPDLHLRQGCHPRGHQGGHRHPARRHHLRGPPDPHHSPPPAVARLHPSARRRARAEDPRILRPQPRSSRRLRRFRLHRRFRRPNADACHRHAPRDPRERSGSRSRSRGCQPSHQRGRTDAGHRELRDRGDVRGLRRLAGRAPFRRHHDGAPERRVRRRDRDRPEADRGTSC